MRQSLMPLMGVTILVNTRTTVFDDFTNKVGPK